MASCYLCDEANTPSACCSRTKLASPFGGGGGGGCLVSILFTSQSLTFQCHFSFLPPHDVSLPLLLPCSKLYPGC